MKRGKHLRRTRVGDTADFDRFARAARRLIVLAEQHGCNSLTAHTATGVWRITITKVSGRAEAAGGNYQRPSLPKR